MDMFKPKNSLVVDPIIDISEKEIFPVIKGGSYTTHRQFSSTSYSNTSCSFTVPPPNPGTFMSRRVKLRCPVSISIGLTVGGGNTVTIPIQEAKDAFRSFPLASVMKTLNVSINGTTMSLPISEIIKPLAWYNQKSNEDYAAGVGSGSPTMLDNVQDYFMGYLSDNNVLGTTIVAKAHKERPRGAFQYTNVVNGNGGGGLLSTATFNAVLIEDLFISPLLFGCDERHPAFIGIQSFEVSITWHSNLAKIWSRACHHDLDRAFAAVAPVINFTATMGLVNDPPALLIDYITPPIGMQIPRSIQYPYNEINRYVTEKPINLAFNEGVNIISNNYQLNSIPRYLYICIRKSQSTLNTQGLYTVQSSPDCYAAIDKIKINWNNKSTLLSNANAFQLYEISRKNGYSGTFQMWHARQNAVKYPNVGQLADPVRLVGWGGNALAQLPIAQVGAGSVFCAEFGTDLSLDPGEAPGLIGTFNIQVEVTGRWRGAGYPEDPAAMAALTSGNLELLLITKTPGVFTIYDNAASQRIGVISKQEILGASRSVGYTYEQSQDSQLQGGKNFWSKSLRIARKANKIVEPILKPLTSNILGVDAYGALSGALDVAQNAKKAHKQKRMKKKIAKLQRKEADAEYDARKHMKDKMARLRSLKVKKSTRGRGGVAVGGKKKKRLKVKRKRNEL